MDQVDVVQRHLTGFKLDVDCGRLIKQIIPDPLIQDDVCAILLEM